MQKRSKILSSWDSCLGLVIDYYGCSETAVGEVYEGAKESHKDICLKSNRPIGTMYASTGSVLIACTLNVTHLTHVTHRNLILVIKHINIIVQYYAIYIVPIIRTGKWVSSS